MEFFRDLEGMKFAKIPRTFTRRIEETNIIAYIVKGGTPANVKYNIFKRINTGGLELKPQEIRHALYQGPATKLCKKLAELPEFQEATTYSIRGDRMMDREFVLRFVAVCYYGIDRYEGIADNYLNGAMEYLNAPDCVSEETIEKQFKRVMIASKRIMGKYAFRKLGENGIRRPINKAIYEAWCRSIFLLKDDEIDLLAKRQKRVYDNFLKLCDDPWFLQAIKASDKKSFLSRFTCINSMLEDILHDKKIRVDNFKCFEHVELELSSLNLFSGINSMGKSTLVQALLLLRQSHEQNALEKGIYLNGNHGEYTVHYLQTHEAEEVTNKNVWYDGGEDARLLKQVECWMGEITPEVSLRMEEYGHTQVGLTVHQAGNMGADYFTVTNVGFGISYVLPVVVSLLKAKEGELVIVENPEAHLHPKGQRKMGKLMARAAQGGVQIIVETHSDHVLGVTLERFEEEHTFRVPDG